jgi:ubiquinone/menaquinone biosynthesis C-methylase UbiE
MSFTKKVMRAYFNFVYNPIYDFTTARLHRYHKLQQKCIGKLEFNDNDTMLCVGVGTGNEIVRILEMNKKVNIVGVDYSETALQKAHAKAIMSGREIEVINMDAQHLEFPGGTFDKVLCLHVMDFVEDNRQATSEIFRVLKDGGQFVITYPSDKEGPKLGCNLLRDAVRTDLSTEKRRAKAILGLTAHILTGFVYLPLILRTKKRAYTRRELRALIAHSTNGGFKIDEDPIYQDFIVYGRKSSKGVLSHAS